MKKLIITLLCSVLIMCTVIGCGSKASSGSGADNSDKTLKIVTTIFPEYDWVLNILGDKAADCELTMLLDNGVDLHSYQPTAEDMLKISDCDMFIYVGGESDVWVEDALAEAANKDMAVINLLETLGDSVKEEEVVEGMQEEDEHEHEHDENGEEHEHEHDGEEPEYDEHVWLSLRNAEVLCDAIAEGLAKIDPDSADIYKANATTYNDKLAALDSEYEKAVSSAVNKTVLFGDRFPFRYLTDDYGLNYYAAFVGCSAETEASFETIVFLAGKVDELGLKTIFTIEKNDGRIAGTIRDNTTTQDQQILALDSMQSVTSEDVAAGTSYLSVMTDNLSVLKEGLK